MLPTRFALRTFAIVVCAIGPIAAAGAAPPLFSPAGRWLTGKVTTPPALADLDGDGRLDVVAGGEKAITVAYGDGLGRFDAAEIPFLFAPVAGRPVIGHVNADPWPDIVVQKPGHELIESYLSNGAGGFTAGPSISGGPGGNAYTEGQVFVGGDFDGDGDLDLATREQAPGALQIVQNAGGAWSLTTLATAPVSGIAVADMNADGNLDLVVVTVTGTTAVYQGDGFCHFASLPSIPSSINQPAEPHVADFDADGDLDVLCADAGTFAFAIAANDGSGHLTKGPAVAAPNGIHLRGVADVDGDSDADVVILDSAIRVYRNNGTGSFTTTGAGWSVPTGMRGFDLARIDGDSAADIVFTLQNDFTGQFALEQGSELSTGFGGANGVFDLPAYLGSSGTPAFGMGLGDLDGDGAPDAVRSLAVFNAYTTSVCKNVAGTFVQTSNNPGTSAWQIVLADLDGDGDGDMHSCSTGAPGVQFRINAGTLGPEFTLPVGPSGMTVTRFQSALGDFDGNGTPDLAVGAMVPSTLPPTGHAVFTFKNTAGTFTPSATPIAANPALPTSVWDIVTSDLDNDGDLDLLTGGSVVGTPINWIDGDGLGGFTQRAVFAADLDPDPGSVLTADFDRDGFVDALVGRYPTVTGANAATMLYGIASGGFGAPVPVPVPMFSRGMQIVDLDGNGLLDILSGETQEARLTLQTAPRTFEFAGLTYIDKYLNQVQAADVDGDGIPELVVSRIQSTVPYAMKRRCLGAAAPAASACAGTGGFVPTLALERCAIAGQTVAFVVAGALGHAPGFLLTAPSVNPIPFKTGCALDLVFPVVKAANFQTSGAAPGAGAASIAYALPPALAGMSFAAQAVIRDSASPNQCVVTNAIVVEVH